MVCRFQNYDGKFRFSQTYDPAKWKRAADANRELIEAAHAAGHDLVREYNADGSIDPFMSCYNVFFLRGDQNPEALFIRSDCNFSEFENMLLRVEHPVTAVWVSIRHWSMPSP